MALGLSSLGQYRLVVSRRLCVVRSFFCDPRLLLPPSGRYFFLTNIDVKFHLTFKFAYHETMFL